jgi:hypothetical protein
MNTSPAEFALFVSWAATGIGFGFWLWSWLGEKDAIQKLRFRDAGMVLVFASILVRILLQDRPMTGWDWGLVIMSPLFIAAALWRLARTGAMRR